MDKSRTIFAGLIVVEPGAHKTDAYQKVRNLLLSDEAEANSAPGLEIEADDVRCTHGATSGQVDEEEFESTLAPITVGPTSSVRVRTQPDANLAGNPGQSYADLDGGQGREVFFRPHRYQR